MSSYAADHHFAQPAHIMDQEVKKTENTYQDTRANCIKCISSLDCELTHGQNCHFTPMYDHFSNAAFEVCLKPNQVKNSSTQNSVSDFWVTLSLKQGRYYMQYIED